MAVSGMAMMLKSLGLDPDELKASVEAFMSHMKDQADKINANQARLEANDARLEEKLDHVLSGITVAPSEAGTTTPILENGKATGVIVTDEKFPQEMYGLGGEIGEASNFQALKQGGQDG